MHRAAEKNLRKRFDRLARNVETLPLWTQDDVRSLMISQDEVTQRQSREEQDAFCAESYRRARAASQPHGPFAREIVAVKGPLEGSETKNLLNASNYKARLKGGPQVW